MLTSPYPTSSQAREPGRGTERGRGEFPFFKMIHMNLQSRKRLTDLKSELMFARGRRRVRDS